MSASSTTSSTTDSAHTALVTVSQLQHQWQQKVASNAEVEKTRGSLGFHRRKVQQLEEELGSARDWEEEVKARLARMEEGLKPALLRFWDKLERGEVVEEELLEDCLVSSCGRELRIMLEQRMLQLEVLERSHLLRLVQTLLRVRSVLVARKESAAVEQAQGMVRRVVRQLGRGRVSWREMMAWEGRVVQELVGQVAGVPSFVTSLLAHLLEETLPRVDGEIQLNIEEEQ